jgi:hypothetical protein
MMGKFLLFGVKKMQPELLPFFNFFLRPPELLPQGGCSAGRMNSARLVE